MILELYDRLDQRRWLDIVKLPLLFVFSLVFFVLGAHSVSAMPFQFTETTGRAVILDDAAQQEARLLALEEALYLAALRGGARINGFSAITADTSLEAIYRHYFKEVENIHESQIYIDLLNIL